MPRPHIEPHCELNEGWKNFDLRGFPRGSQYKVLSMDGDTGACSLKMRLEPGYRRPPGLSYSDLELFVLDGELTVGDRTYGEGQYIFQPAGLAMAAMSSAKGCELLAFYNEGWPTFEESKESHPLALQQAYVNVNSYRDAPWIGVARRQPGVATGCLVKVLRIDPVTKATTFQYYQDNISYHDCAEESYHIWGTSWMLQFGDLPTGGYFWRPPYINHGAFASRYGCIALGRTDSELFNYFHFNPWTNPDENQRRAVAMLYRERPELWKWVRTEGHNHPHGPDDFDNPEYREAAKHLHAHGADLHSHDHDHSKPHDHDHSKPHDHD
jgi:hypothetical protein